MKRFSTGTAIGDGFRLAAARPLAVFVWGLVILGPALGALALIMPVMAEMIADLPAPNGEGADDAVTQRMFAEMMQLQAASMVLNIGQLLGMVVVYTAIFRAVLRPDERSVFSLRIGMDELRVAVVGLAIAVGLYVVIIVAVLLGAALGFALFSGADDGVATAVLVCLGLGLFVALLWVMARVSMMGPASVSYRDFAFVQGWKLASGQAWRLFGMMLLIVLMMLVVQLVVVIAVVLALSGVLTTELLTDPNFNLFANVNGWLAANWGWAALGAAVWSMAYGLMLTVSIAPFASACRQLSATANAGPAVVPPLSAAPMV
jgi:hypothetical protein